jgi:hypothetical protein
MKRTASISEATLQQHVVKLLEAYARHDIEWHHVPNGEKRSKKTARLLKLLGVKPGVGDIMLTIDKQPFAVELKTEIGTQSKDQADFQERFERAGGIYFIAFGLDQAIGVLQGISAFRPGISFTSDFPTDAQGGHRVRRGSLPQGGSPKNSREVEAQA